MICDIFIKTYRGDFCWLDGCLKSIKKYCSGFREVVIVSDDDGHIVPPHLFAIIPFKIHYVKLPSRIPTDTGGLGVGYMWQQSIKLNWIDYTDADMVIIVDSDEMFKQAVTPERFTTDGKIDWWGRKWEEAPGCECHKPSTDIMLKTDTLYETMACPVFAFDRQTTITFLGYMRNLHDVSSFWDIVIKHDLNHISEYNIFGNYINLMKSPRYNFRVDLTNAFNHQAIRIFWSWGGLNNQEILAERERLLNLSCE